MQTTLQKLTDYLDQHGFWFDSNSKLNADAIRDAISYGIIQPIENIGVGYNDGKKSHFYVRAKLKCKEELPASMWNHFVLGIRC